MYITNKTKKYPCTGYYPAADTVRFEGVEGVALPLTGEITLCDDDGFVLATQDCIGYARQTLESGILTLTNEPIPSAPTLDEIRSAKLESLNGTCSGAIYNGVNIGGKHYSFTQTAQGNIKGMLIEAQSGKTVFLYCADNEPLTAYTADQIKAIAQVMGEWINVNTVYYELLKVWVNRETDETVLDGIHYGSMLPSDLMGELATTLAQVGIDLSKYASMLGG